MLEKLFITRTGTSENRARAVLVMSLMMLFAASLVAKPAQAQSNSFTINSLGDAADANTSDGQCQTSGGDCTLRAAFQHSNADAPNDSDNINFGIPGQVNLTGPLPDIANSVNITGTSSGNTVFRGDATGNYRIFNVTNNATLGIKNLTLSNGVADHGGAILASAGSTLNLANSTISGNSAPVGGGIYNLGTTDVKGSTIGLNSATSDSAYGGGIYNYGTLSVADSFFNANQAGDGGGIFDFAGSTSVARSTFRKNIANAATSSDPSYGGGILVVYGQGSVVDSTFSGNSAKDEGGALQLSQAAGIYLVNDTIAGNCADSGDGISDHSGTFLQNTLVALNTASSAPDVRLVGSFTSGGHNLIGNADGSAGFVNGQNGDRFGSGSNPLDPKLQTDPNGDPVLQNNGGPTQTIRPLPGSPAIDAGTDSVLGSPTISPPTREAQASRASRVTTST
jgi:hypothetical protein